MTWRTIAVTVLVGWSGAVAAGSSTVAECLEGSDFIANAARARDNGVTRAVLLARLEDDLEMIRAFPPELRWFAKDADDASFLVGSLRRVFDRPVAPEIHRAQFLDACFARASL